MPLLKPAEPVAGLNDTLRATLGGVAGPFSGNGGSVSGLGAQAGGTLAVGLGTGAAGLFSQQATVSFLSQNGDMADVSGGADAAVSITAQVNDYANGHFNLLGGLGALTLVGDTYYLDYGNLLIGQGINSQLDLENLVTGPADELDGLFDVAGAAGYSLAGWNPVNDLAAGDHTAPMSIDFVASVLGGFSAEIVFNGSSVNADDPTGVAQVRRLVLRGTVVDHGGGDVPEPGTPWLILAAGAGAWLARRRAARVAHPQA